jgi:hypothetical protein
MNSKSNNTKILSDDWKDPITVEKKEKKRQKRPKLSPSLKLPPMSFGNYIKKPTNGHLKRTESLSLPQITELSSVKSMKAKHRILPFREKNLEDLSDLTTLNNSAENLSNRKYFIDDSPDNTRLYTETESAPTRESTVGGKYNINVNRDRRPKLTIAEKISKKLTKNAENTDLEGIHESKN